MSKQCSICKIAPKRAKYSYCHDCNTLVTTRTQHRNKAAFMRYRAGANPACDGCGMALSQPIACFPVKPGSPKQPKIGRLAGKLPLADSVKASLDQRDCLCRNCNRARSANGKKGTSPLKRRCVEYLGGQCSICGITPSEVGFAAFEFHHVAGRGHFSKNIEINQWSAEHFGLIQAELDKCSLICANCHALEHWQLDWTSRRDYFSTFSANSVSIEEFFRDIDFYPAHTLCPPDGANS